MELPRRLPYFDAHCDTLSRCLATGESLLNAGGQCSLERLGSYEPSGQVFAIFHDGADVPPEGLFANARRQAELFQRERQQYPDKMRRCFLSVEGGELLDCDPERLEEAREWGAVWVNLTWNHANALCGAHQDAPERGLTDRGRAFALRLWDLGLFPDVSHLSDRGVLDLAELGGGPLVASHSNSKAVWPHSRNLTDDLFRLIRDSGGIVGINLYTAFTGPHGTLEELLRHFDHFLDLEGEETLALGSDWDGGVTGVGGLRGAEDMVLLAEAMLNHGYGEELVRRIFYENLTRFLLKENL